MALIRCPECKKQISSKAKACPHCGFPLDDVIKPNEEKPVIETVLERKKSSIVASIFLFLFLEIVFVAGFVLVVLLNVFKREVFQSLEGLFIVLMLLFGAASLIAIAGLVVTIIDRAKNNNRLDKNLIEYDNEQQLLIFHSFKDIDLSIDPSKVEHLDGSSKVFLYYADESNKKRKIKMLTLGYSYKDDIQRARNQILSLKASKAPLVE